MPVALDVFRNSPQSLTATWVVTLTATSNAVLIVSAHHTGSNASVSTVIANGNALSRIGRAGTDAAGAGTELWALTAAPTGVLSISAVFSAADYWQLGCVTYTGVKASGGISPVASVTASATAITLSVSSTSTDIVAYFGTNLAGMSAVSITQDLKDQEHMGVFCGHTAGAATRSISAISVTDFTDTWALAAVSLRFSASSAITCYRAMMYVGI